MPQYDQKHAEKLLGESNLLNLLPDQEIAELACRARPVHFPRLKPKSGNIWTGAARQITLDSIRVTPQEGAVCEQNQNVFSVFFPRR